MTVLVADLAVRALPAVEEAEIPSLIVVDEEATALVVVHLHDVLQALEISPTPRPQPWARP
jgi:hypothetical protein